jgi:hypothetical protein
MKTAFTMMTAPTAASNQEDLITAEADLRDLSITVEAL